MVIAGGGTGGHIFPALALAAAVRRREPGVELLFIGSNNRMEAILVPSAGWPFAAIAAAGLRGKRLSRILLNLAVLPVGLIQSFYHLIRFWPQLVVGMGGYVSGPVAAAAWFLRRKLVIHEQNVSPGWTNRILGRLARLVMVSHQETKEHFPGAEVVLTGTPVREEALSKDAGKRGEGLNILVLGGSQGARSLNMMFLGALERISGEGLAVRHQTGEAGLDHVKEGYRRLGYEAEVLSFIEDMGGAYGWADLVICRAGATTIAELAANGCPAILVPFPGSTGGHQMENARHLSGRGAAMVVEDHGRGSVDALAEEIEKLRKNRGGLQELSKAIHQLARVEAAENMAEACLALIGKR